MRVCFIVTRDSSEIPKPPMSTVFMVWKEAAATVANLGFPEIMDYDLFDEIIMCNTLAFERETENGGWMKASIKAATLRGNVNH